jgi:hypothetical protein
MAELIGHVAVRQQKFQQEARSRQALRCSRIIVGTLTKLFKR